MKHTRSIFTTAIHSGHVRWRGGRPSAPAIVPASGFSHETMDELDAGLGDDRAAYVYARRNAPTQEAFEAAMAALEGGADAVCFSSGMAALTGACVAAGAQAGATFLAAAELYGTTKALFDSLGASWGMAVRFVPVGDLAAVEASLSELRPAAFLFETLSNPLVRVADTPALLALAGRYGARTIVDATFTTPYLMQALTLGADVVVHSGTKYIGGHGDVLAGVVVSSSENCATLRAHRNLAGSNLSPFDAWLCLRGLRTLPVRLRQACASALMLGRWLAEQPRIERVYYPGLEDDPGHELAKRIFRNGAFGAMLAFDIRGAGRAESFEVMERLELAQRIPSLGDVTTLVSYPAHASHRSLAPEARFALGIGDGCLRVSVGIEDVDDLIADFAQALG